MKRILLVFLLYISAHVSVYPHALAISGHVFDAQTKEPLAGASVSVPDLRIYTIADKNGAFYFTNIPEKGKFLIEIKFIGYKTQTRIVDFSKKQPLAFELEPSVIEAHEVVITGSTLSSDNRRNSTQVSSVRRDELLDKPSSNLIDAIAKTAGISQVTTGAAVSKPVIRGLSYNRVVTLVNGAKQEGQQWGDEHGIEADQYNTGSVEVLRGAASLLYGSDALGGVINILDPLSAPLGQVRGEVLTNYALNNGLSGNSLMLEGNQDGFVWRARGSYKNAFAYNTPEGRIPNTGYKEANVSAQLGINRPWGYTHLDISRFGTKLGLPDFERNDTGQFEDEDGNVFAGSQLKSRKLLLPFQDVRHYKMALNSNFLFGNSHLHTTFAFQDNQRRELEESVGEPSLFFDLKTYSGDLKYYFAEKTNWQPIIGVSSAIQRNVNKAEELLIPDYRSVDFGVFAYLKKDWQQATFNVGLRYDYRQIRGEQMEEEGNPKFSDFTNDFSNLSGAAGFTYEFTGRLSFKANAGSAFRAPNIAELSSDGVHEGTFRYEIGNPNLKPEKSYYADAGLEYDTDKLHAAVSIFNNYISDYIYYRQLNHETIAVEGKDYRVFRYVQDNANLYGAEASLTFHPSSLIHFDNSFIYTVGENRATHTPLPFIPAARLRNELRLEPEFSSRAFQKFYVSVELDNVFRQSRIDIFETETPAYSLVNLAAGTTWMLKNQPLRLSVSVNNLFDKAYTDHLSRLKYEDILNQGRNVSFGLHVPFILKR